ncbi:phosphatase [Atopobium fossor]|uniref:phosphatase n=1 Tax=Atopobium fossor TaxID=39487 RepID=UPI000402B9FC|nr:phosphatase [Atopobium fossor]
MNYSCCDVHTHTLYSRHAYSTIAENITEAADKGLELLGSADHFSSMLYGEPYDVKDFQYFLNMRAWPRTWKGVVLLRGAEADIVDLDGNLFGHNIALDSGITGASYDGAQTLKDLVFDELDYVVASIHNRSFARGATLAQTTQMYINALHDPKVQVLGHLGRANVPFDVDEVLFCAKDLGKLIEINEHTLSDQQQFSESCQHIAQRAAEIGTQIVVSSDAHICTAIGGFDTVHTMLKAIHFPEELVATRSAQAFLTSLEQSGVMPHATQPL